MASYYAEKVSILGSSAVPTDGVMYYIGSGRWSNDPADKKTFTSKAKATAELTVHRMTGSEMPSNITIVTA
ncbi:MAG: hypothetical protein CMA57_00630 [Euryarchaeota archaeon]|nr:hypothetical protein [Euryarchaeota archaeon]|tara:strand:+ start:757 stop:969 length:213 start_codon:yes stop_codon:yes gene_type:complete